MSAPLVTELPKRYDYITLDGDRSPGLLVSIDDGDRKIEINDQGQLLTLGANTVVRQRKNVVLVYTFKLWEPGHLQTRDRWIKMLDEGSARQPPRVYQLADLSTPYVKRVILESFSNQKVDKPGGPWMWKLGLHEYNRVKTYGGPIKPEDALDRIIKANDQRIADLTSRLAGPVAGATASARAGR